MSELSISNSSCGAPVSYEIRVVGHLQDRWKEWFEGMSLDCNEDGTTTFVGSLPDQAALHSILLKIRDMNLQLISVKQVKLDTRDETNTNSEGGIKRD